MKQNHDLHFLVSKDLKIKLQKEAEKQKISVAELCRRKLEESSKLDRIGGKIERILNN